jgi:hypothetical protein
MKQVRDWMIDWHRHKGRLPTEEMVFLKFAGLVPLDEMSRGIVAAREEIRRQRSVKA